MAIKKNLIANYFGQGWRALMQLAFVPVYIKYLGIEAYGLIAIFAILQAWLGLLDMGLKPALSREMARFAGGAHTATHIWNLLRTIEIIAVAISVATAVSICAASDWLATDWLTAKNLPAGLMAKAITLMGVATALSFIENVYVGSIVGLQRQVLYNGVIVLISTLRGLGAVCLLAWLSSTIEAFFIWQGIISLLTVIIFGVITYRILPKSERRPQFSWETLVGIWRFAAGILTITILSLLLTQVDKILLSKLLTLDSFAHYALAGVVANALYILVGPIGAVYYPRFIELVTRKDERALRAAYHQGSQLLAVLMGSAAVILVLFSERVLLLWTSDPNLAGQVAPLVAVLAVGTLLNGLMWMPYQMQLAHGWTSLTIKSNAVAVCILVPALFWVVPRYGALGAAWVWVILNASYILILVGLMHNRLLCSEKWRWYHQDVAVPLAAASGTAILFRILLPGYLGGVAELLALLLTSSCVLIVTIVCSPLIRQQIARHIPNRLKKNWVRPVP